ncbi:hypothetical protein HDV05_008751 [Chytridiales sp. JEL 0842]|nr:hypothetical protein HDV05_008751 [Chytridiales sp. JEL 0842]
MARKDANAKQPATAPAAKDAQVKDVTSKKVKKALPFALRLYLILFNSISALGWWYITAITLVNLVQNFDFSHPVKSFERGFWKSSYMLVGQVVLYVQSLAALEILHAALRFVPSPLLTTTMQVFSRLTLVWFIVNEHPFPQVTTSWAYTTMVVAWGVTESIRYLYYALNLVGVKDVYALVWCRYTFFYVLYPLGAFSEIMVMQAALPFATKINPIVGKVITVLGFSWSPAFYMMYTHMIKQRNKWLKSLREEKAAASATAKTGEENKKGK